MAFPDGWGYRWPIAINADSVITSPVSTWPCLVTDVHFPAGAWAHMNADASDLRFSSDEDGKSELYYDAPRISVAGKSAHLYVQVPTLSSTGDTTIYAWVGNPTATAPSAAWMQSTYPADWVGFWPMEEGTGLTVGDRTSNANHGTMTNMDAAADWVQAADGSWVLDFDGVDDRVDVGTPWSTVRPYSYGCRVKLLAFRETPMYFYIGHKSGDATWATICYVEKNPPKPIMTANDGATLIRRSTKSLSLDTWHSLMYVYDGKALGNGIHIYVDGVEYSYELSTDSTPTAPMGTHSLGGRVFDNLRNMAGMMASSGVCGRVLSADEAAVHHAQFTPATWASAGELVAVGAVPMIYRAARRRSRTLIPGMVVLP